MHKSQCMTASSLVNEIVLRSKLYSVEFFTQEFQLILQIRKSYTSFTSFARGDKLHVFVVLVWAIVPNTE